MISKEKNDYAIFTVCNIAYLPKALVLAESIFKFNNKKLKIYLFDRKKDIDFSNIESEIYWIEDLNIQPEFKNQVIPHRKLRCVTDRGKSSSIASRPISSSRL